MLSTSVPYSPECVEEEFSEVHGSNLPSRRCAEEASL
jgi:hypothetical protein